MRQATVTLTSSNDTRSVFSVGRVRVNVGSLKFSIRDSKHDLLYKTFQPLATRLVKRQIKKALADAIRTGFEYVDGQLVGVRDRMAEAKASDDGSRREVLAEVGLPLFFHSNCVPDQILDTAFQAQEGRCCVCCVARDIGGRVAVQGRREQAGVAPA
jgi:hypothetical protein